MSNAANADTLSTVDTANGPYTVYQDAGAWYFTPDDYEGELPWSAGHLSSEIAKTEAQNDGIRAAAEGAQS